MTMATIVNPRTVTRTALIGALLAAPVLSASTLGAQATAGGAPVAATQPPRPAPRGIRTMTLTSSAFESGALMPHRHAQSGRDVSPPLAWSGAPDSTRSFVLLVHNVDAPGSDGLDDQLHWLVWNIPGSARDLPEGMPSGAQREAMRQISVSGPYYRGPAAPSTGPVHHYLFELFALDATVNVAPATLSPSLTRAEVMKAIANHVIGKGVLVGRYRRPAP
jgi:Raf kinase inhibitor-like YbhB/YbcL family protein